MWACDICLFNSGEIYDLILGRCSIYYSNDDLQQFQDLMVLLYFKGRNCPIGSTWVWVGNYYNTEPQIINELGC